ncbi:HAMP domain-containing sensor histidine kinase [Nostocoides veronense]|uniref:histidine kinase n=1 Tax=Nostocoides veronense TaxID=330836 RepID=A0ABN2LRP4_9MICO
MTASGEAVPEGMRAGLATRLHRLPLRLRLIAILLALLLAALTMTAIATSVLVRRELIARLDDNLHKSARSVASRALNVVVGADTKTSMPTGYSVIFFPTDGSPIRALPATDVDAVPDLAALTLDDPRVVSGDPFTLRTRGSDLKWRAVAGASDNAVVTFVVAQPLRDVDKTVQRLLLLTTLTGLGLIAACLSLGWFAVARAFRPLSKIEDTAAAIAAGDLTQRVPETDAPDEVASLSRSFNTMIGQVEESFGVRAASQERMRQFVADASHELRTPLATVRGYAELYRQGAVPEVRVPETIARIETEAARMTNLVDDLLLLARLDEKRATERTPVDLTVVLAEQVQAARVRDPERRITLQGKVSGGLTATVIDGEEPAMHQVFGNLLTNAIRHTPEGTPIDVVLGGADGIAVVEVRDHGPGIDEATKTRVFERFFREDKARSRESGGTGLGLAIVAAIVERHGGRVGIKPTPGGGATFVVELPLQSALTA